MAVLINDQELEIDIAEELQPFIDSFPRSKIRDEKLQSCSPFREDNHPSFAVNLENGSWIDSGAVDDHHKGHFIELLSFLRQEMIEDTAEYLIAKYGVTLKNADDLHLDLSWLHPKPKPKIFFKEDLQPYAFRSPYLAGRGISEKVQKAFKIGYDKEKRAVMMPWMDKDGHVINMKFRSIDTKKFWYAKEGQRIKYHLYGLNWILKLGCKTVWVTESEIDALKLWTHGMPAVACGTANMSKTQKQLLLNSPVEEIVIAADNDPAGDKFANQLKNDFVAIFSIRKIRFEKDWKDIGDIPSNRMEKVCSDAPKVMIEANIK